MGVIGQNFLKISPGIRDVASIQVKFGQLDTGTRIGMALQDLVPDFNRRISVTEFAERFRNAHAQFLRADERTRLLELRLIVEPRAFLADRMQRFVTVRMRQDCKCKPLAAISGAQPE